MSQCRNQVLEHDIEQDNVPHTFFFTEILQHHCNTVVVRCFSQCCDNLLGSPLLCCSKLKMLYINVVIILLQPSLFCWVIELFMNGIFLITFGGVKVVCVYLCVRAIAMQ